MRAVLAALVVSVIALISGCGGTEVSDLPEAPSDLARLMPENPFGISEVDLVALKEALGLPADADPGAPPDSEAQQRLAAVARAVLPFCGSGEEPPEPIDIAIREAVDCSRVEAAAAPAGVGLWSLTIMRTEQPFEEIADSLTDAGYSREGRLLGYPGGDVPMRYLGVVAGPEDDSLIALSRDPTVGFAALGGPFAESETRPALSALAALPAAPARTAWLDTGDCIAAYAMADRVEDERGELVVRLEGDGARASADGFVLPDHEPFAGDPAASELFDFDEPDLEGATLRVGFALRDGARRTGPIAAFDALSFADPYQC